MNKLKAITRKWNQWGPRTISMFYSRFGKYGGNPPISLFSKRLARNVSFIKDTPLLVYKAIAARKASCSWIVPRSLQANPAPSIHTFLTLCSAPSQVRAYTSVLSTLFRWQFLNLFLWITISAFSLLNPSSVLWWTMMKQSLCQVVADTFRL